MQVTRILVLSLAACLVGPGFAGSEKQKAPEESEELQQEELVDYYKKWLNEDVVYIITDDERQVFERLVNDEERDAFIEQFWHRRDTDPNTAYNEFKEEHYRRIAYANERFYSGVRGWKSDRGRIYIALGPADSVEQFAEGRYQREFHEGGGETEVYPFERWWYRHVPGVGSDIEIEFVDSSLTGEYELVLFDWEKDALLLTPGAGPTTLEILGITQKTERPYFSGISSGQAGRSQLGRRLKDQVFQKLETYFKVQAPPKIKYKDLKQDVESRVLYGDLSSVRQTHDLIRLNERDFLTLLTVEVDNRELQFEKVDNSPNIQRARVSLYGQVKNLTGRLIREFDDELEVEYEENALSEGLTHKSTYQHMTTLGPGRYKLNLIVKDVKSDRLQTLQAGISVPEIAEDQLQGSTLILAKWISALKNVPDQPQMFVLGDLKVYPSVNGRFSARYPLFVYFNLYNVGFDQASGDHSLDIAYEVLEGRNVVRKLEGSKKDVYYSSDERVVVVKMVPLETFEPGSYRVRVNISDRIKGGSVHLEEKFEVVSPS